ncbi:FAD-dependent oxidoreductase [Candidatus Bipolaricaulota bacterium]|nr:FAD-dependent oxidoreductase [Candidatus Bipolaricaulota bacterium]
MATNKMVSGPVVVIGGGAAGIACACSLADRGYRVTLIEQGPRLGGRAGSLHHPSHGIIDFGQHILMRCCTESSALFERLGVGDAVRFQPALDVPILTHDTPEPGRARIASASLPAPLHLLPSLLRYRPLSKQDRIRVIPAALSLWRRPPKRGELFSGWLTRRAQSSTTLARFWDPISIAALNASASDVDVADAGKVFRDAFLTPHGADLGFFLRPLSELFGAAVPYIKHRRGMVLLGTRVRSIEIENRRAVGVRLATGDLIPAATVISAVPPAGLAALLPDGLATDRHAAIMSAAKNLRWAPIVNLHLWFDRSVMNQDVPFFIAVDGPVQAGFDVSAIHHGTNDHHVVLSQSNAQDLLSPSDAEILDRLLRPLMHLLPMANSARLKDSLVVRWRKATFVPEPGAHAFRPGSDSGIDRLQLAGDWIQTGWPSTIEGAVRAGLAAAMRVSQGYSATTTP